MFAIIEKIRLKNRHRRALSRRDDPRFFEKELFIMDQLIDGGTVIDVGANKGLYTLAFSKNADHVVCFEPNPKLAAKLKSAAPANCEVRQNAVSDFSGMCTLTIPEAEHGGHSPNTATLEQVTGSIAKQFDVEAVRLDDLELTNVSFIKVDVEGHEEGVINGARNLIEAQRPTLMLEFNEPKSAASQRLFSYFSDLDYTIMQLHDGILKQMPKRPETLLTRNVLFFPDGVKTLG